MYGTVRGTAYDFQLQVRTFRRIIEPASVVISRGSYGREASGTHFWRSGELLARTLSSDMASASGGLAGVDVALRSAMIMGGRVTRMRYCEWRSEVVRLR